MLESLRFHVYRNMLNSKFSKTQMFCILISTVLNIELSLSARNVAKMEMNWKFEYGPFENYLFMKS